MAGGPSYNPADRKEWCSDIRHSKHLPMFVADIVLSSISCFPSTANATSEESPGGSAPHRLLLDSVFHQQSPMTRGRAVKLDSRGVSSQDSNATEQRECGPATRGGHEEMQGQRKTWDTEFDCRGEQIQLHKEK